MYELLTGIPPYYTNVSKEALFHNIKYGKLTFPSYMSLNVKNLIVKLLHRNPNRRLGSGILDANEIKTHPFFAGIDFNKILYKQFLPPKFKNNNNFLPLSEDFICNKELVEDMKSNKKTTDVAIEGWTFIGKNKYALVKQVSDN
jgi:protein-serine/threonine kinase